MRGENVLERESGEAECEEERDLTTSQHDGRQDSGGWTPSAASYRDRAEVDRRTSSQY